MNKLIIANWKMNPGTREEATSLARAIDSENLVICPPFPFLEGVAKAIKKSLLGAQDLFYEDKGAFTGEVSGKQLTDLGVKYVIIGHSERRRLGDTDQIVVKKVSASVRNGIIPVLCVGESGSEHASGKSKEVIKRQLEIGMSHVAGSMSLVVAYEPVWAISTEPGAKPDTPENAVQIIIFMKDLMKKFKVQPKFIYGGSVNADNAEGFLKNKEIGGALVGGASLRPEEIRKILKHAKDELD